MATFELNVAVSVLLKDIFIIFSRKCRFSSQQYIENQAKAEHITNWFIVYIFVLTVDYFGGNKSILLKFKIYPGVPHLIKIYYSSSAFVARPKSAIQTLSRLLAITGDFYPCLRKRIFSGFKSLCIMRFSCICAQPSKRVRIMVSISLRFRVGLTSQ